MYQIIPKIPAIEKQKLDDIVSFSSISKFVKFQSILKWHYIQLGESIWLIFSCHYVINWYLKKDYVLLIKKSTFIYTLNESLLDKYSIYVINLS